MIPGVKLKIVQCPSAPCQLPLRLLAHPHQRLRPWLREFFRNDFLPGTTISIPNLLGRTGCLPNSRFAPFGFGSSALGPIPDALLLQKGRTDTQMKILNFNTRLSKLDINFNKLFVPSPIHISDHYFK